MAARLKLHKAPWVLDPEEKKPAARAKKIHPDREKQFLLLWRQLVHSMESEVVRCPEWQFKFDAVRKWAFDFAWPSFKVAVEIEGGIFQKNKKTGQPTGHRSIGGLLRDVEKYNAAAIAGWCVIRIHAGDLDDSPVQTIEMIFRALAERKKDFNAKAPGRKDAKE